MLAELSTSPPPAVATTWHEIPWAKCRRAVGKLQVRIAKAVKVGHWRAVPACNDCWPAVSRPSAWPCCESAKIAVIKLRVWTG